MPATKTKLWPRLSSIYKRDKLAYWIVTIFFTCVALTSWVHGLQENMNWLIYPRLGGISLGICILGALLIKMVKIITSGTPRPLTELIQHIKDILNKPQDLISFVLIVIATVFFISAFTSLKSMIPEIIPFKYDPLFYQLDKALHFGNDPWRLLHASTNIQLSAVTVFLYHIWFFIYWAVFLYFAARVGHKQLRIQYLASHYLCWAVIGGAVALSLSSAGPCFYGLIYEGEDPYGPLMETLYKHDALMQMENSYIHLWPLDIQDRLWEFYSSSATGTASGISAMPSMHVSIAVLMALGITKVGLIPGIIAWIYAACIQFGSVYLGWHYAIDGYLAAILTVIIWKISGWLSLKFSTAD